MSKVGIIGYGVVGEALEYGFGKKGDTIKYYDKFKPSSPLEEVVRESELVFVCLPTPYRDKKIDLTIMDENVREIDQYAKGTDKAVVIKSTVVPGTTRRYAKEYPQTHFGFNPEFLVETHSRDDFLEQDRIIIGADDQPTSWKVADFYRQRFPGVPLFLTDPTSAEMTKYMANAFLAMKVVFGNEFHDLCTSTGISYDEVRRMVSADKRIGESHLSVTSNRGFGGKCFPKDIVAILGLFQERGVDAQLLTAAWEKNLKIRKVKDWETIPFAKTDSEKKK